mmetsp:Transcript_39631/g.65856  ORF Transcript_39631/g.65856 Transcript_39631/m.65856 type:complete len:257 (-) Transcript_39631:466-1236(-)
MARGPGAGSGSQGLGATWGQVRPHRCRGLMYIYIAIQNDQPHLSRASSRSRYRSPHNRSCRRQPAPDNGLSVPAGARWRMGNGGHQGRLRGGKKENNPPSQGQNRVVTIAIQTPSIACQPPMGRIAGQGTSRPRSHLVRQLVPDHRVVLVPDGLPMRVLEECLAVSTHPTAEEAAPLLPRGVMQRKIKLLVMLLHELEAQTGLYDIFHNFCRNVVPHECDDLLQHTRQILLHFLVRQEQKLRAAFVLQSIHRMVKP